ncbi:DUF3883 domain-containing protein [Deinococcus detaillensis]|uniref:DUF3883 domain-containing protein n=1 Tax=Deinococcus detaillensis TaxID=2592048 RepID=A0A553UIV9_9DEIO|nr:DUF3883 domain-containing protein [Deinococcus detaillensis]TSA79961.1 DUF3883 domain-containing protein [Deinococcus detaillensis]
MPRKLAVRRIQHSELTYFQPLFERIKTDAEAVGRKGSKQKAINLDKAVLIDMFYPMLASARNGEFGIVLNVFGPDDSRLQSVGRKISKPKAKKESDSKNWRLHGATIRNPLSDPDRYDVIEANDFLVMEFFDAPDGTPGIVNLQVMSRSLATVAGITADLDDLFRNRLNMVAISESTMANLCARTALLKVDPLSVFSEEETLIEAALTGDPVAVERVLRRRRIVTRQQVLDRQRAGDENGLTGEALVFTWLDAEKAAGRITDFTHDSTVNAVQPHDFTILSADSTTYIDAKTTSGRHVDPFHMSGGELIFAATSAEEYRIYRVSEVTSTSGVLRVSSDARPLARTVAEILDTLPEGIRSTSVTIRPGLLEWSEPVPVSLPPQPPEA